MRHTNLHSTVLALAVASGCLSPVAPHASSALPTSAQTKNAGFEPPPADSAFKARIATLSARLDQYFQKTFTEIQATALAVGIVRNGELVYARGFGVQDTESKKPVDIHSVFRIASMTKSFTAAAILKLRDEGKLALDAPAAAYIAELAPLRGPTTDAPPFSVRQLLTHASGLPWDDSWGVVSYGTTDAALERLLRSGVTLANVPGARYSYSNLGYALLGKVVERVSGRRFRDYVTENLLHPLGMHATVWESDAVPSSHLAIGYRREGESLIAEPRPTSGAFDAGGGLYTSLSDYARYVALQLQAYPPRDDVETGPLRRSTLRELHQGQVWARWRGEDVPIAKRGDDGKLSLATASYGFGWLNVTTCGYEGIVQHFGMEPGYWSTTHLLPQEGIGLVTLATTSRVPPRIFEDVLRLLKNGAQLPAANGVPVAPALQNVRVAVNSLLERWDARLLKRVFDRQSLKFPWMATLEADFSTLRNAHGHCRPVGALTARDRAEGHFGVSCERGAIEFSVYLTPAAPPEIQLLTWQEELPPTERLRTAASRLAALLSGSASALPQASFAPTARGEDAQRSLAHIAVDFGSCQLQRVLASDGRTRASAQLECLRGPLELTFEIDASSGLVTELTTGYPGAAPSLCSQ